MSLNLFLPALAHSLLGLLAAQDSTPQFYPAWPDPIIARSEPGSWDSAYNDPGAVVEHDGVLHMFNNGFDGWPTSSGIGHYISEDGIEWEAAAKGPVFRAGEHKFDGFGLVATSAIVTAEGQWRLYVTQLKAIPGRGVRGVGFRVLLADDPNGEWKLSESVLLKPGPAGAWDEVHLSDPMVLATETGYLMFFTGADAAGISRIGRASSSDGLKWTKLTSDASDGTPSNPLMGPTLDWESGVNYPSIIKLKNGYGMIYRATGKGGLVHLGRAFSKDGLSWIKGSKPVFAPKAMDGSRTVNITALVEFGGETFLYVDGFVRSRASMPYVLTPDSELFAGLDPSEK